MVTTIADLLSHAASTAPENGVVDLDGTLMAWGEVQRRSAAMAASLRRAGVRNGDRVAVLHPKSTRSFIAMHAAMQAGAIAVPLDPFGATDQLAAIIEQTTPAALIGAFPTVRRLVPSLLESSAVQLVLSGVPEDESSPAASTGRITDFDSACEGQPETVTIAADDAAYIIFTSGSTGTPKGIVHTHASCIAYATRSAVYHRLGAASRLAGTPPLHFDMSTLELYSIPFAGATAITIGEAPQRFPATLSGLIEEREVTHLYAVPFQLRQLEQRGDLDNRDLSRIEQVAYGGEPYAPGAIAALEAHVPGVEFLNVYGPAEVNCCTIHSFTAPDLAGFDGDVPIGITPPGIALRVVDEHGHDVTDGETGELLVSSPQQMTGYWRQPEKTAASVTTHAGRSWYATGDVARIDTDRIAHFLGRRDHQVKVRGFRIELEAIETVLTDAPGVAHAVVGVRPADDGADELAAWVVLAADAADADPFDLTAMRTWCRTRLAAAAIPASLTVMSEFPMTQSGKIDRRKVRSMPTSSPSQ